MKHARHYIDSWHKKGHTIEDIRNNRRKFQLEILDRQVEGEASIKTKDIVFMDRAIPGNLPTINF